jgi:sulfoxide reductase heme-binding subunit YedZ
MQSQFGKPFFDFVLQRKQKIITIFRLYYGLLGILTVVGIHSVLYKTQLYLPMYSLAIEAGRVAIVFLSLTLLPGIFRRLGITMPLISALMLVRRYLGVSVFMNGLFHYLVVRGVDRITGVLPATDLPLFETLGFTAISLMFWLFATSNDWSVSHLGKWWKRLHRLVYVIAWLLFGHVALQQVSIWSILIGAIAILEVISWVKVALKKPTPPSVPPPVTS